MTADFAAAVCWSAVCWIAGVGYGRYRLVTWEKRLRRSLERRLAHEAREGARNVHA